MRRQSAAAMFRLALLAPVQARARRACDIYDPFIEWHDVCTKKPACFTLALMFLLPLLGCTTRSARSWNDAGTEVRAAREETFRCVSAGVRGVGAREDMEVSQAA